MAEVPRPVVSVKPVGGLKIRFERPSEAAVESLEHLPELRLDEVRLAARDEAGIRSLDREILADRRCVDLPRRRGNVPAPTNDAPAAA